MGRMAEHLALQETPICNMMGSPSMFHSVKHSCCSLLSKTVRVVSWRTMLLLIYMPSRSIKFFHWFFRWIRLVCTHLCSVIVKPRWPHFCALVRVLLFVPSAPHLSKHSTLGNNSCSPLSKMVRSIRLFRLF